MLEQMNTSQGVPFKKEHQLSQGSHRLEKYLNLLGCLEKS